MNHRLGMRKSVRMNVTLEESSLGLVQCTAEDVGFGGIFIRTRPIHLFPNTTVTLQLNVNDGPDRDLPAPRLPARVVWSNGRGAGLMFTKYSNDGMDMLRRLLLPPRTTTDDNDDDSLDEGATRARQTG